MPTYVRLSDLEEYPIRRDHCDKDNADPGFIHGIESVFEYIDTLPVFAPDNARKVQYQHYDGLASIVIHDGKVHLTGSLNPDALQPIQLESYGSAWCLSIKDAVSGFKKERFWPTWTRITETQPGNITLTDGLSKDEALEELGFTKNPLIEADSTQLANILPHLKDGEYIVRILDVMKDEDKKSLLSNTERDFISDWLKKMIKSIAQRYPHKNQRTVNLNGKEGKALISKLLTDMENTMLSIHQGKAFQLRSYAAAVNAEIHDFIIYQMLNAGDVLQMSIRTEAIDKLTAVVTVLDVKPHEIRIRHESGEPGFPDIVLCKAVRNYKFLKEV